MIKKLLISLGSLGLILATQQTCLADAKQPYKLVNVADSSFMSQGRTIVRKALRITIPVGLSKSQLENALKSAAWNAYKQYKPNRMLKIGWQFAC